MKRDREGGREGRRKREGERQTDRQTKNASERDYLERKLERADTTSKQHLTQRTEESNKGSNERQSTGAGARTAVMPLSAVNSKRLLQMSPAMALLPLLEMVPQQGSPGAVTNRNYGIRQEGLGKALSSHKLEFCNVQSLLSISAIPSSSPVLEKLPEQIAQKAAMKWFSPITDTQTLALELETATTGLHARGGGWPSSPEKH